MTHAKSFFLAKRFLKILGCCLAFTSLFTSCTHKGLLVETKYLSRQNLASYHVGTPDPLLENPAVGQELIISWSLPVHYMAYNDLHLQVWIRYKTRQEVFKTYPIEEKIGRYVYALLNEDYFSSKGILTYKVQLVGEGQVRDEWCHPLWNALIQIGNIPTQQ